MPTSLSRSRIRLLWGTLLVVLFTLPFFIPEIVTTYWHLRFGDSTTYHQWKVPVPRSWAVFSRGGTFILQKPTRFYETEDAPTIGLEVRNAGKPVKPEELKQAYIQVIEAKGYSFQEEKPIQIASNSGYCLKFKSAKDPRSFRISCDSLSAELSVDYFGPESEIDIFYSVVSRITALDGLIR